MGEDGSTGGATEGAGEAAQQLVAGIVAQVRELGQILNVVKDEITSLRAREISQLHIPLVNEELDAIAAHTAAATNEILDACEMIDPLAKQLDEESAAQMLAGTMRIYTACGFQDLVGQRIRKVLRTLITIDTKIENILETFGPDFSAEASADENAANMRECLMNGPQLPKAAMAQAEIDRLLAGD
jgi:chemotaxis protein CheZ